jgi:hypothetical protein
MQIRFLKIVLVCLLPWVATAQSKSGRLQQADSLFRAKQYTQAFVLYQSVLSEKNYTTAMLLKMAYIQEGLGHIGSCLYYLNLYHLASGDEQALGKMEELAQKKQLEGYTLSQQHAVSEWWQRNFSSISFLAVALAGFLLALAFVQRKRKTTFLPLALVAVVLLIFSFLAGNFLGEHSTAIVESPRTYVLDAPSAGGTVVEVLSDGHRIQVTGATDVWQKVIWRDKVAYIKRGQLRDVKL